MSKKIKTKNLKTRESYTTRKLAETVKVHIRTLQSWKKEGLKPIANTVPLLFMGFEVKQFLQERQKKNKVKLQKNQFYCVRCRKAVFSNNNQVEIVKTNKVIGKNNLQELIIRGVCENCNCKLNRFSHKGKLQEIKNTFTISNIGDLENE